MERADAELVAVRCRIGGQTYLGAMERSLPRARELGADGRPSSAGPGDAGEGSQTPARKDSAAF